MKQPYIVERWSPRGITFTETTTKREASRIAASHRGDQDCQQTIVRYPNGRLAICRNTKFRA